MPSNDNSGSLASDWSPSPPPPAAAEIAAHTSARLAETIGPFTSRWESGRPMCPAPPAAGDGEALPTSEVIEKKYADPLYFTKWDSGIYFEGRTDQHAATSAARVALGEQWHRAALATDLVAGDQPINPEVWAERQGAAIGDLIAEKVGAERERDAAEEQAALNCDEVLKLRERLAALDARLAEAYKQVRLLARLAAPSPQFFNPLEIAAAQILRDKVLEGGPDA